MQIVASSHRGNKHGSDANADTMMDGSSNETATTSLFGKWQTEPWHPPAAIGGIVPKVNSFLLGHHPVYYFSESSGLYSHIAW